MLLTVEWNNREESVEIYCDRDGLELLVERLGKLAKSTKADNHDHLMTPSWAGTELTEEKQGNGNMLVNHLRITLLP